MREDVVVKMRALDASLAQKVNAIITGQWGRRPEDVKDLQVEQLYERRVHEGGVSYRPCNRFVLEVKFFNQREARRILFTLR